MSHPIDDLFKKGLEGATFDGHDKDWIEAQRLLGLKSRRRRRMGIVLFFFAMAAVVALSTLYLTVSKSANEVDPSSKIEYAATEDSGQEYPSTLGTENEKTASANVPAIGSLNQEKDVVADSRESGRPGLDRGDIVTSQNVGSIPKSGQRQGDEASEVSASNAIVQSSVVMTMDASESSEVIQLEKDQTTGSHELSDDHSRELDAINNRGVSLLSKLTINSLLVSSDVPFIPSVASKLTDQQVTTHLSFGLYTQGSPLYPSIGAGVFSAIGIADHWSIDVGLGVNYKSMQTSNIIQDVSVVGSSFGTAGQFETYNEYRYHSLEIPIRVSYGLGRHQLIGGLSVERPLVLSGQQEASLIIEQVDTATPEPDPGQSLATSDPISANQNYNINSTPQLDRFFLSAQLGYGYRFNRRWQLALSTGYHFMRREVASPLVRSVGNVQTEHQKWDLNLRINYFFN